MTMLFCVIGQLGNGGTERQMYLFLKYLDRERFHPFVIVSGDREGIWTEQIRDLEVEMMFLDKLPSILKLAKFRYLVMKHKPDKIFSWSFFTNAFNIVRGRSDFIGSLRQQLDYTKKEISARRVKLGLDVSRIVVNSSFLRDELLAENVPENRIHVVHNIYERIDKSDRKTRQEIRAAYGIPQDAVVIGGVGRDSPSKDFPFFVDSVEKLLKSGKQVHALIVGSAGLAQRENVKNKGIDVHFTLPGEIPDAKKILHAADIFFLSSRSEGLANVLFEAVDAGCACVSTDVGGVRDLLGSDDDQSGFIIDNGDLDGAVKTLTQLINDPDLRETMAGKAEKRLQLFDKQVSMDKYYQVLEQI